MENENKIKASYYFIVKYKPEEKREKKLKILGKNFLAKNKNKCKIIYKNKNYELKEYFEDIDINYNNKDLIKFKIIFTNNNIDISYMFYNCDSLISVSLSDYNEINKNIIYFEMYIMNMSYMFYGCKSLISIPDISSWNILNFSDMNLMFCECNSLKIPDYYILNKYNNNIIFELTYKKKENKEFKLKILNKRFIEINKYKGTIIYNNCEYKLKEYFEDIDNNNHNYIIKFLLCLDININDISYIFNGCDSLISIEYYNINIQSNEKDEEVNLICESIINQFNLNKYNNFYNDYIQNISENISGSNRNSTNVLSENKNYESINTKSFSRLTDINNMFDGCNSLISLPDISKWNTSSVENMEGIFNGCKSLKSLPDISEWNTFNVNNMSSIFSDCNSLISLPDISKWITSKVNNMSSMFYGCKSLISLLDISKWNTYNIKDMTSLFEECKSLISLPDISKWNVCNVKIMRNMFDGCTSLLSLPDLSKWNMNNVQNISCIFLGCKSLASLPDISKWNTSNTFDMSYMLDKCTSLLSLPDLSRLNISNVYVMNHMFFGCISLISLPDISKWNSFNVNNNMLDECFNCLNKNQK